MCVCKQIQRGALPERGTVDWNHCTVWDRTDVWALKGPEASHHYLRGPSTVSKEVKERFL